MKCCIDDILITGPSDTDHLKNLEEVLKHLKEHGVKANQGCTLILRVHFLETTSSY